MGNSSNIICGAGIRDIRNDGTCPFQLRWKTMINRCYSKYVHEKRPTYSDKEVCQEWLTFSNFKAWMEKQDWEGLDLDKDILIVGNKEYSPRACCFVPSEVNNIILLKSKNKQLPFGVSKFSNNNFRARLFKNGKDTSLGSFKSSSEAHKAWQWAKATQIEEVVAWYALQKSFRTDVAEALTLRTWNIRIDHSKNLQTNTL